MVDTSLSVMIAVTVVLVAAVAVYVLFRDFSMGTSGHARHVFELRRPALIDDPMLEPRVGSRPSVTALPVVPAVPAPAIPTQAAADPAVRPLALPPPPPQPSARTGADTWAELWAARKQPRPYLRCRDGEDLLGKTPVVAPGATPSGLDHFMAETDLAMGGPGRRPLRSARASRPPASADQGTKVLPYAQRDASSSTSE